MRGALAVLVFAVMIATVFLANSHVDRDQAKKKVEAIETTNRDLSQRVRNLEIEKYRLEQELHACKSISPEVRVVIKKVPGIWWSSPQDTVRDTLLGFFEGVTDTLK